MSKQRIDAWLPVACTAMQRCGVVENGAVDPKLRSQISSFGAAVTMGSLLSAVAFFSQKGRAASDRQLLMKTIHFILLESEGMPVDSVSETSLGKFLAGRSPEETDQWREKILDAAVAIKLSMNLYNQGRGEGREENGQNAEELS